MPSARRREVLRYQVAIAVFMLLASAALALFTQDLFGMMQLTAAVGHLTYRLGRLDEHADLIKIN